MLRRNLILPALVGAVGAAAFSAKAKADQLFTNFAFLATGGTATRTMPDRLSDVVNVLDYGADPTNTNDSSPAIQAALDAAFGSSSSPHGLANASSNKPVFIPNGSYKLNSNLVLTRVVGGHIYGAGAGATVLNRASGSVFAINGSANLVIERLNLIGGGANSPMIDLDWDNTAGGDGLHANVFRELLLSNFAIGIIIAKTGFGGADNLFQQCALNGNVSTTGIEARAATALNNLSVMGGAGGCAQGYYCSGGSIHVIEQSSAGNTYDVRVDSGFPVAIIGGRTESGVSSGQAMLKLTSGLVTVRGFFQAGSAGHIADISGGKVTFDGCVSSCVFSGAGGSLYIRGCSFPSASVLTGYSGTVVQNI